jgi:hypothetical protein
MTSVYVKKKDEKTTELLLQLLRKPEINENNPPHIQSTTTARLGASFLKELVRDLFGDRFRQI